MKKTTFEVSKKLQSQFFEMQSAISKVTEPFTKKSEFPIPVFYAYELFEMDKEIEYMFAQIKRKQSDSFHTFVLKRDEQQGSFKLYHEITWEEK